MGMIKSRLLFTLFIIYAGALFTIEILDINRFVTTPIFAALLYIFYRLAGLSLQDIGVAKVSRKSVFWAVSVFAIILMAMGLVYLFTPDVFLDKRYNQSFTATIITIFFTLPLATVVIEELAFRGVLLGYFIKTSSTNKALFLSSALFGIWHIPSSFDVHVNSFLFIRKPSQLLITSAIVLVTSLAGWAFSLLRLKTKNILVPIVAHWSINACGILFAWLAWSR